jgi:TPR repeat protein
MPRQHANRLIAWLAAATIAAATIAVGAAELSPDIMTALDRGAFADALRLLRPLAGAGDAQAQTRLAELYRRGQGVPQDFAAAALWYRRAAEQGEAVAQNALGALYGAGWGVAQDHAEAVKWYRLAAEQGAAEHQFDLAVMYDNGLGVDRDFARAAEWYARAAGQGLADAEASLGFLYQQGAGVAQDFARAFALYSRAAQKGNAKAQNNLGLLYTRGEGVAQDYALAVDWYRKAAEQGFAKAITNLGVMYENGFGVKQDEDEAMRLYRLGGRYEAASTEAALDRIGFVFDKRLATPAAEGRPLAATLAEAQRGDPDAQFILAWLLSNGPERERDFRAAARWYQSAAGQGRAAAMANLGLLYVKGLGVPQDYVLGYTWINLAAARGLADAVALRDTLARQMTAGQINEAQQRASRAWAENSGGARE